MEGWDGSYDNQPKADVPAAQAPSKPAEDVIDYILEKKMGKS